MYFLNQTSFEVSTKQGPGFDVMFDNAESLSKLLTLSQVSQLGIKVFGKPFKSGTGKTAACQSIVEHIKKGGATKEKPGATDNPEQFQGSNRASMSKAGEGKEDAGKAPKKPVKPSKKSRSTRSGKKEKDVKTSKKGLKKQIDKTLSNVSKAIGVSKEKLKEPVPKKAQKPVSKAQEPGKRGRKTPIYTLTTGKDLPGRFKTPENKKNILVNNHAWALLEGIEALIKANGEGCQATAEQIVSEARETRLFKVHGTNETAKRLMTRWHKCLKYNGWLSP